MSTLPRSHDDPPCPWLADAPIGLDDSPISLLTRVAGLAQQTVTRVYAKTQGLTPPEWRLLARLASSAPMQFSLLCRTASIDKAQAGRVLRGLEARALVSTRPDEGNRRRIVVDVTPRGRALAKKLFPVAEQAQRQLLAALAPFERQAMYSGLKKLLAAMQAEAAPARGKETE